ncbi:DNA-directed DNA polymerase [Candidatus Aciduliprofundum boonei]|uniref:DNA-directed DNA polymerase n=1 Tax=Candidatus Aciduliprofundum boonei TaxID=379547 RepID=UPI0001803F81|nr:DNA polymerase II [Candidatus Aciduliprofundum boonei]EDY35965.1 DNA polymerase family B [Aciduliprofundum boonei T469]HII55376.1 DNA polymerase II [Candidatus Aciduliprofundum boonei]
MYWDVRLLTASYSREEDGVVVELYGKTREGKSIVVRYKGFKPYFYLVEPPSTILEKFSQDPEIYKMEEVELWHKGKVRKCVKVTLHSPWKTPRYRREALEFCDVLAADIPFHQRFIYDFDLGSCVRVYGKEEEKGKYTTELVVNAEKFENIGDFKPPLKILSFDIENSMKNGRIFTIGIAIWENGEIRKESIEGDEKDILWKFLEMIWKEDPDIITGYNIDGYDLELLSERYKKYGMDFLIGRDKSKPQRIVGQFWRLHGRVIEDAWWAVKKELRLKQETLQAVAMHLFGEGKLDVDRTNIDEEWEKDKEKVIEYCKKDAELALRILLQIGIINKYLDLATVTKFPLEDVIHSGTSTWVDSLLIREADRHNIGVPLQGQERKSRKIEGGYVHTIEPGLYHWVCVLDFKSMYPSIIIKYNICFTTLSKDGDIVSPTGVRFLSKEKREGLIPKLLAELMKKRDELKRKMKEDPDNRDYYNGLQKAVKILMNTFYGVLASSFYRFTNPDIGASITAFARDTIKRIIAELESEGIKVVYGDTDSVFFQSPYEDLENTIEFGMRKAEEISRREKLILEFEKILEPFFSHGAKKRYVGRIIWPDEEKGNMVVRGYEIRRTDSFDLQSEAQRAVFEKILDGDIQGAIELAREIVSKVRAGKVPIESLVISRTVKDFKFYKNPDSMPNVQAARKLIKMGQEFIPGMKVAWIVVNARGSKQDVEPYIPGMEFNRKPDYRYYARRVAETLARITDVFGVDEENLLTGSRQISLGAFGKEKKKKTLFDFE